MRDLKRFAKDLPNLMKAQAEQGLFDILPDDIQDEFIKQSCSINFNVDKEKFEILNCPEPLLSKVLSALCAEIN